MLGPGRWVLAGVVGFAAVSSFVACTTSSGGGGGPTGFTLTVGVDGQGEVTLDPAGGTYEDGTEVTLTLTPGEDWLFSNWTGDLEGATNPATIVMDGDKAVTAVLLQPEMMFNTRADFEAGALVGLEYNADVGGLRLAEESTTLPFIWVPNSNENTISKVDTRSGDELGRYRVAPPELVGDPSRTTVDLWGSCFVANRDTGTLVKVGLYENGGCVDRDNDSLIHTSTDVNEDGDITGDELLAWGEDECVLYEVVLTTEDEGPYAPGEYPGTYPNGHWNPGTRGIAVDADNNVWVGVYGTYTYYHIDGTSGEILRTVDVSSVNHTAYGALVDGNGVLWSSGQDKNHLLRLDPADDSFSVIDMPHFVYGLGVDHDNHLFVSGWNNSKLSRINVLTGEIEWTHEGVYESRGVAVTDDGDVWVADSNPGTVTRWSNDGEIKATIAVGNTPTGVAVDADGKVWVVNNGDEYIRRIDPATGQVDLEKAIVGARHYGYSDMTGIVARTVSTRIGNWTISHALSNDTALLDRLIWQAEEPEGTVVRIRVRTSNDQQVWSDWLEVTNDTELGDIPAGRYVQIEVTLQTLSGEESAVLSYLAVLTRE